MWFCGVCEGSVRVVLGCSMTCFSHAALIDQLRPGCGVHIIGAEASPGTPLKSSADL
jgi:hypothetical protein